MYKQLVLNTPYRSIDCVCSFIDEANNQLWKKTIQCAMHVVTKNQEQSILLDNTHHDLATAPFWEKIQIAFFEKSDLEFGNAVIKIYEHLLSSFPLFTYEPGTHLYALQHAVFDMQCCFDYIYSSNKRFFEEYFESIRFLPFLEKQTPSHSIIKTNLSYSFVEKMMHAIYLAAR